MTEIRLEQRIAAPPATVYRYLTEADRWRLWQGASADLDARPGGLFSMVMPSGMRASGSYLEVEPGRRVVFTWGWEGHDGIPPGSTIVEIVLDADGDGTTLTLVHRDLPPDEVASHTMGWRHYLPRLALAAAGLDPGPDAGPGSKASDVTRPTP